MAVQLSVVSDTAKVFNLIKDSLSDDKLTAKFYKAGTLLPPWHISNVAEWTNSGGNCDMQTYLTEFLNARGLGYTINGNNQLQLTAFP